MKTLKFACALAVVTSATVASAQDAALLDFSGGARYDSYYGSLAGDVIGWTFDVNYDIFVTDLGYWIDDQDFIMDSIHEVGIWTLGGVLLADTVVDPNTAWTFNGFNYQSIDPLALEGGQTYVIGGMTRSGDNDWYVSGASSANWGSAVTFVESRYPLEGELGFVFPGSTSSSIGRFGPNFLYSDIPAPGALALLGLAGLVRRRLR